ncbi:flagellar biosynthetic protein FliR [Beijerinckia sp. L45]|uniref:flagellar biosynthetic protein FliR n=1 Tax=Beijerinckia sp. L45 TaxID=1641855 RepID=UPI001FF00D6E|nr:flagellar biosynthetic protein FliR [Beijerinckia sp. L45]
MDLTPSLVLSAFVVFCRIGGCILLMPGFSSPRIPVQARLFVAIAVSLAMTPLVIDDVLPLVGKASPFALVTIMIFESLKGVVIGLLGRLYFIALETLGMAISMSIGLSANLGAPVDESEALPAVVTLITLGATLLLFVTDLHWEVFRGLSASYVVMPVRDGFDPRMGLLQLVDGSTKTFILTLRIASPFLIFSIIANVAIGIINKLVPQIPVTFVSTPFLLFGGGLLFYFTISPALDMFTAAFGSWLKTG